MTHSPACKIPHLTHEGAATPDSPTLISQHRISRILGRADYARFRLLYRAPHLSIYPNVTRHLNNACAPPACTAICVWLGNMWCSGYKHAYRSSTCNQSTSRLAPKIWNEVRGFDFLLWRHIRERLQGATATDRQTLWMR
jgi:hypothetical protein